MKEMKEREISLLQLLTELLLEWRAILIWMAAGAVLAGAFSFVRTYQISEHVSGGQEQTTGEYAAEAQKEADILSDLKEQLTDMQLQNVNYVAACEKIFQEKLDHMQDSVVMQLDPKKVQHTEMTFYVDAAQTNRACDMEKVYEDLIQSVEFEQYAADCVPEETAARIGGIISLSRGSDDLKEGTNTFQIRMIHYDKKVLRQIADAAVSFLEKKQEQVVRAMGAHEIVIVSRSETASADMEILDKQRELLENQASMERTILQYKDAFTPEEQNYYDYMTQTKAGSGKEDENRQQSLGHAGMGIGNISKKYVALGMVLAVFLYLFVFFIRYACSNRLGALDSLRELYGIPQLGTVPQPAKGRKPFAFIDRWILSFQPGGSQRFTKDEALCLSVAAIKIAAAKKEDGKMLLVGCGLAGQALQDCETIREKLAQEGIQAEVADNALYDEQALRSLEGAGAAVLVVCARSAFYSEIVTELELLRRQEIDILGGIVIRQL